MEYIGAKFFKFNLILNYTPRGFHLLSSLLKNLKLRKNSKKMHVDLARIFQKTKVRKWLKFIEFINSVRVEFTSNEYHDLTRFSGQATTLVC